MSLTCWSILFLPLVTAILISVFLLKHPKTAAWFATLSIFTCFFLTLSLYPAFEILSKHGELPFEAALTWISFPSFSIEFGLLINGLTLLMLMIVTGIGGLIFLYSMSYMEKDESYARYFACLSLFTFSMLGIVLSNNLIQIFIFWELVGLSSYLLIGFWYEKREASTAGKKAFLTTRIGDVGMMIGILILFGFLAKNQLGTFNFLLIQNSLNQIHIPSEWMTAIALLIFLGVAGKSAQVPLHVWLPDAMEGPTPVSALIHAATMVAAGVFLLTRLFFLFVYSEQAMMMIAWTGAITAFLAATMALVQNDIKKVLAYSTLSQLGYMVMALGLKSSEAGMFHLTTHAFFKALLFLGAGSFIHSLHTQDIWEITATTRQASTSLFKKMPVTTLTFLIGTLALMGIPPLSGFFSKEEVLIVAHSGPTPIFWLAMITVFLTAFYMGRLCTILFFGGKIKLTVPEHGGHKHHGIHEADWRILIPLILLAVLSALGGYFPIRELLPDHSFFEGGHDIQALSLTFAIGGFILAFLIYRFIPRETLQLRPIRIPQLILERKYFFDDLYDFIITYVQGNFAKLCDWFERIVVVEGAVNGTAKTTRAFGDFLRMLQTGMVQFYALLFAGGITLVIFAWILWGHA